MVICAKVKGITCASCAEKIQSEIKKIDGVLNANINIINQKLNLEIEEDSDISSIKKLSQSIAGRIERGSSLYFEDEEHDITDLDSEIYEDDSDNKKKIIRIIVAGIIMGITFFLEGSTKEHIALIIIAYTIIGGDIVINAFNKLSDRDFFDEEFLMTVATFAAIFIGEYQEAVAVMLFYQFGELLQERAVVKSRKALKDVINLKADYANLKTESGYKRMDPESVEIGDIIIVKPGEKVPLDGVVIKGSTRANTAALTGESVPIGISPGDSILSGYINENNTIEIKVEKKFRDSAVAKILDLVENAGSKKAPTEKFITKFSKIYTPFVVGLAFIIGVIFPLITGGSVNEWLYRAAIFLVISCPCALVVSVPLGFFGGIGACSKNGILVKGGNYLEALSKSNYVVMDKTGTLTKGVFSVKNINAFGEYEESEVLEYAALAESFSNHPIAKSIVEKYEKELGDKLDLSRVGSHQEIAGHGIKAIIDGREVSIGNKKLAELSGIDYSYDSENALTIAIIIIDGELAGEITISDEIKSDSKESIEGLKNLGIENIVMLTGDSKKVAEAVAKELGIENYSANLLPNDKLDIFENMYSNKKQKETIVFVGDGINDAPTLARADIGIAMGGLGSDAAIEAADVVIMTDEPSKIVQAIRISKKVKNIVIQNIVFALGVKGAILLLGVLGFATMWEAVFADVGVALIAVLNSIRALRIK